mmetsp:Transcript_5024/g.20075  ORF Transcript_5024/g.20075 Transcript_5024/m.20075 type:complete len:545 (-) Transcript_5024:174-1808(-)
MAHGSSFAAQLCLRRARRGTSGEESTLLPKTRDYSLVGVGLIFVFPALGGLLFGFDIGSVSLVVNQLADPENSGVDWHEAVGHVMVKSTITSASVAGAFVGAVIVFPLADVLGRRRELAVGSVLYMLGCIFSLVAFLIKRSASGGLFFLLLGRFVYGVGVGFTVHGAPSYISEMSPPELRGTLVAGKEAAIMLGILLGNAMGIWLVDVVGGWRWVYLVQLLIAIVVLAGALSLPPSARWLALRGDEDGVVESLKLVFTEDLAEGIALDVMEQTRQTEEMERINQSIVDEIISFVKHPRFRPQLICGLGVVTLQQITGQPSVMYYTDTIFRDAGIDAWANILVGAFKLLMTLASVFFVDRVGRKRLLLVGNSVMAFSLFTVSVAFHTYQGGGGLDAHKTIILVFLLMYIGGYQIGFGPVVWTLVSEVFPLQVRGQAIAVAAQANFLLNLVVTFLFLLEIRAVGNTVAFAIFSGILFYSLYFVHKYVPETKGLTLEEIEDTFERGGFDRSSETPLLPDPSPLPWGYGGDKYGSARRYQDAKLQVSV